MNEGKYIQRFRWITLVSGSILTFLLLAAWFFARSSETWHRRLLDSELFGPIIRDWETNRCLSLRTKLVALGAMLVAGCSSIALAISDVRLKILTALLLAVGAAVVLMIPTCRGDCDNGGAAADDEAG